MSKPRIGISGWRYEPWRRTFYPPGLAQKRELEFASRQLNSIEINGSFYSLQRVSSWESWRDETPGDFVFSVKGGRYITHLRRLREIEIPLANFFAQGVLALKEKLGPFLWQFPPNFKFDAGKFESFFKLLPHNTTEAVKLAKKCEPRMKKRSYLVDYKHSLRHAVEVRHESFESSEFLKLLKKYNIAVVIADTAGKWPMFDRVTSDFVYARLHGDEELYVSGYTPEALDEWASRIRSWRRKVRDIYAYFDNDVKVRAPFDAIALAQRVGGYLPEHPIGKPPAKLATGARTSWPIVPKPRRRRG